MTTTAHDLRSALEQFCQSAECAAGCDEGVTQGDAYSEILSFGGSALAVSYANARAALAAPATDEPVAWMYDRNGRVEAMQHRAEPSCIFRAQPGWTETPLYTHPPAAEPVGLREALEKIAALRSPNNGDYISIAQRALATPARTDDAAQAGGDVALLDRAEMAWQRFFYPAADNFTGLIGDKLPSVDLEVADCLRLVLAAMGRHVVPPAKDIPALSTPTEPEALAACPFCGGEAERFTIKDEGDNFGGDVVCCKECGASSHVEFGRKENLVSCWNRRTPAARMLEGEGLQADVISLVVAGREAWEAMLSSDADPEACAALDKALERFASRVCYDDEGGDLPDAHADPCTCGSSLSDDGEGG